ncbi:MAG: DnaB-like helicase C-terminal domain-containing protein [Parachlamydiaceae bacterium]
MDKETAEEKKCLFIINIGDNFKAVHDHIKSLNGFFNGTGWYVEQKHKEAVSQLCQQANIKFLDFPILADSFDAFKKQHKASYYYEKSIKINFEILKLRELLNIPQGAELDDILKEDQKAVFESIPDGKRLIALAHEYDIIQKRIKQAEEEERLSKLHLDTSGAFLHLLQPASEQQICDEITNTSPGIHVGFNIGDIELKIPGGAISIIAAPTSHGKTTQLINFSLGALDFPGQEDKSVYFFSYEESRAAIVSLFLNTYIGDPLSQNNRESIKSFFRIGDMRYMSSEGRPREIFLGKKKSFFEDLISTGRLNIFYSEMTAQELVAAIRFLKKNTNVGLVCIDYMQLLKLGLSSFGGSRQEELKQVCLLLKDCAIETGLPILLAAQFSRQVTCEADLSPIYLSEAGDIERVANMIIGFWNRNFEGFTREGNKSKKNEKVPKEPAIYMEILKGRETGSGHSEVFNFDGNAGKLTQRPKHFQNQQSIIKNSPPGHKYN